MRRFHLHQTIGGDRILDPVGIHLADETAARLHARLVFEDLGRVVDGQRYALELEDEQGRSILLLYGQAGSAARGTL